ncbi:hypothetical protein CAAN3_01S03004 [[Candida] anglica]
MNNIADLFGSSVNQAVQISLAEGKPLLAFLTNDQEISSEFIKKFLYSDSSVNEEIIHKLKTNFVCIKLLEGTTDFEFFKQIFPNLEVPSFYVVEKGKLLDVLTYECNPAEFETRIDAFIRSESSSPIPPLVEDDVATSPSPSTTQPIGSFGINNSTSTHSIDNNSPSLLQHQKKYRNMRNEQQLESQRIRNLLNSDVKEREAKKREEEIAKEYREKLKNQGKDLKNPTTNNKKDICVLSIKLLDGKSLVHEFTPLQTLNHVREWLDMETNNSIIPDDSASMPSFATSSSPMPTHYVFYRPVLPRITYTDEQEFLSLKELELCPRSALILKPIYEDISATKAYPNGRTPGGIYRWIYENLIRVGNALYSFFDYGVEHFPEQDDDTNVRSSSPGLEDDNTRSTRNQINSNDRRTVEDYFSTINVGGTVGTPNLISVDHGPHSDSTLVSRSASLIDIHNPTIPSIPTQSSPLAQTDNNPGSVHGSTHPSRSSTPKPINGSSQTRFRSIPNADGPPDEEIRTYNGNSVNLKEKKDE